MATTSGATWSPVWISYGYNNRTQMLRIPGPGRIEDRTIDGSCNPYLAAAAFERLVREYPESVLVEETEFFIGDSFFLAKDFDGAVTKYQFFKQVTEKYPLRFTTHARWKR